MAFEFIKALPAFGDAITAGAGIYSLFDRPDPYRDIPTLQPMLAEIERAKTYEQAALNPESAMARNLSAIFAEADRKAAVKESMGELLRRRRELARGGVAGGINPERRDESRYRALLEMFDMIRDRARTKAIGSLQTAAQGARANVSAYAPFLNLFSQYAGAGRAGRLGGIEAAGGALGALANLFGGGGGAGGERAVIGMPWLAPPAAREVPDLPWLTEERRRPQYDFYTRPGGGLY